MTGLHHLGFDVSTTGAAAVLLTPDGSIAGRWVWQAPKDMHVDERIFEIGWWARRPFSRSSNDPGVLLSCSIESPFFRGPSSAFLAMAQGAVRAAYRTQWGRYAPEEVKATARRCITTTGSMSKERMIEAFTARWRDSIDDFATLASGVADPKSTAKRQTESRLQALGDLVDAAWVAETDRLATQKNEASNQEKNR